MAEMAAEGAPVTISQSCEWAGIARRTYTTNR